MPPAVRISPSPAMASVDADDHTRCDAIHNMRIAGLADAGYFAVLNADIRLVNARTVHDERIRDDRIQTFLVRVRA